jgi:hypothetical protein
MRPRKPRQAAALQTEPRRASVECGSLHPLSTPGRASQYQDPVGALLAAPAAAPPSPNGPGAPRLSRRWRPAGSLLIFFAARKT